MTYLTLCVATRQECRVAGTGPTTVTGQVGVLKEIVDWVAKAYEDIQRRHQSWRWLRSGFTVNTVASTDTYAYGDCTDTTSLLAISRFSRWLALDDNGCSNVTCYLTSTGVGGEVPLIHLTWSEFREIYMRGIQTTLTSQPVHFTVDPLNRLKLGPNPSGTYTIKGEYQKSPQALTADADVPELPAQFHDLIMYRAMEKYGASNNAVEVYQRGGLEGNALMSALELDQLPAMRVAGAMV